ncbi:hypothetical protein [Halocalculus aciditolerans]|uniref:Uncharacterized protein n=1 Tax=Halocalculus aciditolerans TaxID=1383812 RepID=A0A830FAC5_9EURY|nr:hypothetical protein [Halocalculus aciditolerans]GGL55392.1 hypothetical protein GCM10009039_11910 [Halocalculus aciditolerans]
MSDRIYVTTSSYTSASSKVYHTDPACRYVERAERCRVVDVEDEPEIVDVITSDRDHCSVCAGDDSRAGIEQDFSAFQTALEIGQERSAAQRGGGQ